MLKISKNVHSCLMYIHVDSISNIPQKQFIIIINNIMQTNITVTYHRATHSTWEGVLPLIKEGVQTINTYTKDIIRSKTHLIKTINRGSSYPVRPTKPFNTYQENKGNSDKANSDMDIIFPRNQIISKKVHHNGDQGPFSHKHHHGNYFHLVAWQMEIS